MSPIRRADVTAAKFRVGFVLIGYDFREWHAIVLLQHPKYTV